VEQRIVELAQHGDQAAFASIALRITPRLFTVANRILRDRQAAEDATQQALLQMWRKLPKLTDAARLDAWAYRIVVNACYAAMRRSHRAAADLRLMDTDAVAGDASLSIGQRDMLERAFSRLSAQQRAVLVLQYSLDLDHSAIADLLGIPIGTVKSRASSARQAMRAGLEADERLPGLGRWPA
jgi:RNA polymerase sigma-70 factor (ECF subfamily)